MTKHRAPTHAGDRNEDRRHRTEPHGHAVPNPIPDDITGQYEGEELRMFRARRDTHIRIERLEDKHDTLVATSIEVNAKLGMLVSHAEKTEVREEAREKREHDAREADRRRKWWLALIAGITAALVGLIGALR